MNEAKSIHVYGRHTLINQLFGRAVERELGVGCVVHRSFERAKERESDPPFPGLSVVDDTDEVARRRLMRYLVEPGRAERSATALFNVERTGPRIHAAVRCGVRGVFLSIDRHRSCPSNPAGARGPSPCRERRDERGDCLRAEDQPSHGEDASLQHLSEIGSRESLERRHVGAAEYRRRQGASPA